jgi:class 3 adenylate cyclase/uncharacterized protein (DUF427 family)
MSVSSEAAAESIVGASAPDYRFTFEPYPHRVRAVFAGVAIADSDTVMVLEETRLAPVYYFPREHVRMDLMRPTDYRTHCPFKGNARYWTLEVDGRVAENLMWSYEYPVEEGRAIKGYMAFYSDLMDAWYEDGQASPVEAGRAASEYTNPLLAWLISEAPELPSAKALTQAFADQLLAAGVPLWRMNIIIRTLHPQLMALSYRWWRKNDAVEEVFIPYEALHHPRFLHSPLVPIFEGAGGIRRRLDIPNPALDFPILEELHAEGGTDYVAMPMTFSDGQINTVTIASAQRGGFSTSDLGHIYEILKVLGRLYEVHAMRYRATILLDTYLGRHAGARVLDGLIKRGDGEDIQAVIWFCDLRGSTPLAQSMSRSDFLGVLNQFFDCMAGAVLDHGGEVLRFIGDAALAIFPIAGDGTAAEQSSLTPQRARENALAAAEDAGRRIAAINEKRRAKGRRPLEYGLALHPGEVTYGNIGTKNRLEFTVIGDAANQAARIESMCKTLDRPVLVSSEFARHFPDRFEALGPYPLRGVAEALELFALREAR